MLSYACASPLGCMVCSAAGSVASSLGGRGSGGGAGAVLGLCVPDAAAVPRFLSVCSGGADVVLSGGRQCRREGEMETELQHSRGGFGWCHGQARSWLYWRSLWPRCLPLQWLTGGWQ